LYGKSQVLFLRARTAGFPDLEDLAKKLVDLTYELKTSQRQVEVEEALRNVDSPATSDQEIEKTELQIILSIRIVKRRLKWILHGQQLRLRAARVKGMKLGHQY
jgi:hypothetical protein